MQRFKLALIIAAIAIFAIACNDTNDARETANANAASTPAASSTTAATNATTTNTASAPKTIDEFVAARSTYDAVCIRCHQENGEGGNLELDKGMTLKVPSFKKGHGLTHTDSEFARQIANGGDGMPAFKERLTSEQIDSLVRFIRHEFQAGLINSPSSHDAGDKH